MLRTPESAGLIPESQSGIERVVTQFANTFDLDDQTVGHLEQTRLAIRASRFSRWIQAYLPSLPTERRDPLQEACASVLSRRKEFALLLGAPPIGGLLNECLRSSDPAWGLAMEANLLAANGADLSAVLDAGLSATPVLADRALVGGAWPSPSESVQAISEAHTLVALPCVGALFIDPFDLFVEDRADGALLEHDIQRLRAGLGYLEVTGGAFASDVARTLQRVVPSVHRVAAYSATSQVMTGRAVVSLNHSPDALAEALVHEAQHSKLAMVIDSCAAAGAPLVQGNDLEDLESPWRPDLRPAEGILHGCASFLVVAEFWARADDAGLGPHAYAQAWLRGDQVRRGLEVLLSSSRLTEAGEVVAAGFRLRVQDILNRGVPSRSVIDIVLADETRTWLDGRWSPPLVGG